MGEIVLALVLASRPKIRRIDHDGSSRSQPRRTPVETATFDFSGGKGGDLLFLGVGADVCRQPGKAARRPARDAPANQLDQRVAPTPIGKRAESGRTLAPWHQRK